MAEDMQRRYWLAMDKALEQQHYWARFDFYQYRYYPRVYRLLAMGYLLHS